MLDSDLKQNRFEAIREKYTNDYGDYLFCCWKEIIGNVAFKFRATLVIYSSTLEKGIYKELNYSLHFLFIHQPGDILTNDIEFNIDKVAFT